MSNVMNISGQRFGRLVAIEPVRVDKRRVAMWKCVCDCGKAIITSGTDLRRGKSKSCGCYAKDVARKVCLKRNTTHGMTGTRIFNE